LESTSNQYTHVQLQNAAKPLVHLANTNEKSNFVFCQITLAFVEFVLVICLPNGFCMKK